VHIAWGSFLLALLVIVLVPGPDFVMVTRSAASGRRYGWLAAAGIVCGLCLHATAASLGLSALVVAVPAALFVVKALGVAYLVWMGFQVLRKAGRAPAADGAPTGPVSGRGVFVRALLTDLLNPKVMLTFLTLLPQAMDPAAAPMPQAALLSGVAVGAFAGWWLVVVPSVGKLAEWLASPRRKKVFERVCGSTLIAMATSIAVG
jgi:threonine/homoserine/homoserine lactone efflux protein